MAPRRTMRQLRDAKHTERLEEYALAIAEGRVTVRQMTAAERAQANLDRARVVRVQSSRAAAISGH